MFRSPHDDIRRWLHKEDWVRAGCAAGSLLAANPGDLVAWQMAASALLGLGRTAEGAAGLRECSEAALETGNLPLALTCHASLRQAGEDASGILARAASLYHRGSSRVRRELRLAPPLPADPVETTACADEAAAAERTVAGVRKARDQHALDRSMAFEPAPLPSFPLLGALCEPNLRAVLERMDAVCVPPGGALLEQGAEGDAVFVVLYGRGDVVRRSRSGEETILRRVLPGGVVGEIALVTRAPRVASVRTEDGLLALKLPRAVVEELADLEPGLAEEIIGFCRERMLANLVEASPLLRRIDGGTRAEVLASFDRVVAPAGTVLVRQGEESPGLFVIVVGGAEVVREDGSGGDGIRLAQLGPADVFGEMSLLLRRPAGAGVRALCDTALLRLPRERFMPVVEAHPGLLAELYRLAEEREEETRSLLGRPSESVDDLTLM